VSRNQPEGLKVRTSKQQCEARIACRMIRMTRANAALIAAVAIAAIAATEAFADGDRSVSAPAAIQVSAN
jgi:hypothetical protein